MSLNEAISNLTKEFTVALVAALGKLSLDEFVEISERHGRRLAGAGHRPRVPSHPAGKVRTKSGGRLARRTTSDIQKTVDQIVAFLSMREGGTTAERIRIGLGIERKELPRPLKEALRQKLLTKKGHKRATMYFVSKSGGKASAKKSVKAALGSSRRGKSAKSVTKKSVTRKIATKSAKSAKSATKKIVKKSKKISKSNGASAPVSAA